MERILASNAVPVARGARKARADRELGHPMRRTAVCITIAIVLLNQGGSVSAAAQGNQAALRNRLADASSPYLRSAAKQPVHWQEWSNDVFALARKRSSITSTSGRSGATGATRWTWFENPSCRTMNDLFIPVKVDRDFALTSTALPERSRSSAAAAGRLRYS
jgi:hypothetical protein